LKAVLATVDAGKESSSRGVTRNGEMARKRRPGKEKK